MNNPIDTKIPAGCPFRLPVNINHRTTEEIIKVIMFNLLSNTAVGNVINVTSPKYGKNALDVRVISDIGINSDRIFLTKFEIKILSSE